MSSAGGLSPVLSGRGDLVLRSPDGHEVLRYGGLRVLDATGRVLPSAISVGHGQVVIRFSDHGSRYPVVVDPWVEQSEISAADGGTADHLGTAAALSGDGSWALLGAPGHRVGRSRAAGAAYLFHISAGAWTQAAELRIHRGAAGDKLGTAVALSADGSTAVVGAPGRASGGGAAYVFTEPRGGWADSASGTAVLTGSAGDQLGEAVAVSGDGSTVVVGAPGHGGGAGAAFVVSRPASGWSGGAARSSALTASDLAAGDQLGYAVVVSADGATVGAGAPDHLDGVSGVSRAGAVFVYARPGGGWTDEDQTAELVAGSASTGDQLGSSLALSADGAEVAAGAPGRHGGDGSVLVFGRPGAGWSTEGEPAELTPDDPGGGTLLGVSVAMSADGAEVAAGAPLDKGPTGKGGEADVFRRPGPAWSSDSTSSKLGASDGGPLDWFGRSLAVSADGRTSLVASPLHAIGGLGAGAGYLFSSSVPTFTNLVASDSDPDAGRSVTYTAQVLPKPSAGTVTFSDGTSSIPGCAAEPVDLVTGRASCTVAYALVGNHSISASFSGDATHKPSGTPQPLEVTVEGVMGYSLTASDGSVASFGKVHASSAVGTVAVNAPVVGAARDPGGRGGWLFTSLGGVFAYGGAPSYGSLGSLVPAAPVVGGAGTPDGQGYWLFGADGGVMGFGDAGFHGSLPTVGTFPLAPIAGGAGTPDGQGYWLFGSNGAVFAFGDASFFGSARPAHLSSPVVAGVPTADGRGYWLFTSRGTMLHFGDALSHGSLARDHLSSPITSAAASSDGEGYWMFGADGSVYSFGDAGFDGSLGTVGLAPTARIVAGVPG